MLVKIATWFVFRTFSLTNNVSCVLLANFYIIVEFNFRWWSVNSVERLRTPTQSSGPSGRIGSARLKDFSLGSRSSASVRMGKSRLQMFWVKKLGLRVLISLSQPKCLIAKAYGDGTRPPPLCSGGLRIVPGAVRSCLSLKIHVLVHWHRLPVSRFSQIIVFCQLHICGRM